MLKLNDIIQCPFFSDNAFSITFDDSSVSVKDRRTNRVVAVGAAVDGLYQLDLSGQHQSEANSLVNLELWHARLGHISEETTRKVV